MVFSLTLIPKQFIQENLNWNLWNHEPEQIFPPFPVFSLDILVTIFVLGDCLIAATKFDLELIAPRIHPSWQEIMEAGVEVPGQIAAMARK